MKITVKAPANIAFIKYWGKINEDLRLPANSSISMNLSNAYTITSVEFDSKFKRDIVYLNGKKMKKSESNRVIEHLDRIRLVAKTDLKAKIITKNNFPKSSGIASSASGFAALTVAACKALGLDLNEKQLSVIARLGSGSACRSIPDGIVEWKTSNSSNSSYAYSLYPADYWDISDIVCLVGKSDKKVSSSEGHALAESSPFYKERIKNMPNKILEIKNALRNKDFDKFGEIVESEAINMHAVMMTSNPPLFYWNDKTIKVIEHVWKMREKGIKVYFTIDAGPNVHLICKNQNVNQIKKMLLNELKIQKIIVNTSSKGASLQ